MLIEIIFLFLFSGAASASKLYTDAIMKLARQSQQGTWGGSADIGKLSQNIIFFSSYKRRWQFYEQNRGNNV